MALEKTKNYDPGAKLGRMHDRLVNPDAALKQIGALGVAASQKAFKAQEFGNTKWKPRGVPNFMGIIADFAAGKATPPKRRMQDRPALRDTGRLAQSIAFQVQGATVEWGSNLDYASVMNFGGVSESAPLTDTVRDKLAKWLKKRDAGVRKKLGWLLNPKFAGKRVKVTVPARPFVGVTDELMADIEDVIGATIFGVRG